MAALCDLKAREPSESTAEWIAEMLCKSSYSAPIHTVWNSRSGVAQVDRTDWAVFTSHQ